MEAVDVIAALGLGPHPEGGHYRETWADVSSSAIYFLLCAGEESAWHRVRDRVEVWHLYAGSPLELDLDAERPGSGTATTVVLGTDLGSGQRPQAVVPAGTWQRARTTGPWSLVGCTVSPPFSFDAFELAPG